MILVSILKSEDHTQDFLHIFNITHPCHVCSLHSSALQHKMLTSHYHSLIENNFSAAVRAHHLKCHLQPFLPNIIWKFYFSSHLGSHLSLIIINPQEEFLHIFFMMWWRRRPGGNENTCWAMQVLNWHHCLQVIWKRVTKKWRMTDDKAGQVQWELALFDISIWHIDCRYIDTFEKYRYRYQYQYRYGHFWKYRYRYRYR